MTRFHFDPFVLDCRRRKLLRGDAEIPLGHRAFDVLALLLRNPGAVIERERILHEVWAGDLEVSDGALSQTVLMIRRALGHEGRDLIRTVARTGYAFDGTVTSVDAPDPPQRPKSLEAPSATTPPGEARAPDPSRPGGRWLRFALPLLAVALALGVLAGVHVGRSHVLPPAPLPVARLEVLPPQPLLGRRADPWLADALWSILATEWKGVQGIVLLEGVDPGTLQPPAGTARLAGLVGSAPTGGDGSISIDWQLLAADATIRTWRQQASPDRLLEIVPALQVELLRRTTGLPLQRAATSSVTEAQAAFARGLQRQHAGERMAARSEFEQALALDPGLVAARVQLARVLDDLGFRTLAISHARRALDDARPGTQGGLRDGVAAELHALARDFKAAAASYSALAEQDPGSPDWRIEQAKALVAAGDARGARLALGRLDPDALPLPPRIQWWLARKKVDEAQDRVQDALAAARAALSLAKANGLHDDAGEALIASCAPLYRLGDYAGANASARGAVEAFKKAANPDGEFRALFMQLQSASMVEGGAQDADFARIERIADALGNVAYQAQAQFVLGARAQAAARFSEALAHFLAAKALTERAGDEQGRQFSVGRSASAATFAGRLSDAADLLDSLAPPGTNRLIADEDFLLHSFELTQARGDLPGALALAAELAAVRERAGAAQGSGWHCAVAALHLDIGQAAAAAEALRRCDAAVAGATAEAATWAALAEVARARMRALQAQPEAARRALQQADQQGSALLPLDRAKFTAHQIPGYLAILEPASAVARIRRLLDDPTLPLNGRLAADAHGWKGLAELAAGDRQRAAASLALARAAAPSGEGRTGRLLDLLELALAPAAEPDGFERWIRSAEADRDLPLIEMAGRLPQPPAWQALAREAQGRLVEPPSTAAQP